MQVVAGSVVNTNDASYSPLPYIPASAAGATTTQLAIGLGVGLGLAVILGAAVIVVFCCCRASRPKATLEEQAETGAPAQTAVLV